MKIFSGLVTLIVFALFPLQTMAQYAVGGGGNVNGNVNGGGNVNVGAGGYISGNAGNYQGGGSASGGGNWGTGLVSAQRGCGQNVQMNQSVMGSGNEQMRELVKQYKQMNTQVNAMDRDRQRAELDLKRAEGKLKLVFDADSVATIKSHVDNVVGENKVTCSSYFVDTSKPQITGQEGSERIDSGLTGSYTYDPFTEGEWKKACPVGSGDKSNSTLTGDLCKMKNHLRSTAAMNDFNGCSQALTNYQRQAKAAQRLAQQVADLKDQMSYVSDSYNLEKENYLADQSAGASGSGIQTDPSYTESGFCVECARRSQSQRMSTGEKVGSWFSNNTGNIAQVLLGIGYGALVHKEVMNIADYNASIGQPTEGAWGQAIMAGGGLVANGVMGMVSGGGGTAGGAQGSFACGGNAAGWSNGGVINGAGGASGNANQWLTGNPYLNSSAAINGTAGFNPGFSAYNTNGQYNMGVQAGMNGLGGLASLLQPFASISPFNVNANGQASIGNGIYAQGGAGMNGPSVFGQYPGNGIPNTGYNNGQYSGNIGLNGIINGGANNGLNGGLYGGANGGFQVPGWGGGMINVGGSGGLGGSGGAGGNMVCNGSSCYYVNGGMNGGGNIGGVLGTDYNQTLQNLQLQQQALQQQQAQAQAQLQAYNQYIQNEMARQQQAAYAQMELRTAYQKWLAASQGSYGNSNSGNLGANGGLSANLNFNAGLNSGASGYINGVSNGYIGAGNSSYLGGSTGFYQNTGVGAATGRAGR